MKETYAFISRFMVFSYGSVKVLLFFHMEEDTNIQISLTQRASGQLQLYKRLLWQMLLSSTCRKKINMNFLTTQSYSELHDIEPKKNRVEQTPQGHLTQQFAQGKTPGDTNIC